MTRRKEFGEQLKEYRKEAGLTQAELAKRAGVSRTYISKIENEKIEHTPSLRTLEKMATALNVDKADMIRAANKIPSIMNPIMGDPDALKFFRHASGVINTQEGWETLKELLDKQVADGGIK